MQIELNGQTRSLDAETLDVEALLRDLQIEQRRGVAIAINDRVVPRSTWQTHTVQDGDRVEIIRATQGG